MGRVTFTAGRVDGHKCDQGRAQAFIWDTEAPGLGLRATPAEAGKVPPPMSFIFQAKLDGKTIRLTIGDRRSWSIEAARAEARRLKVMIDNKQDPRQVKAEILATARAKREAEVAKQAAAVASALREAVTLGDVWPEYIADRIATRKNGWSEHHVNAHKTIIQTGGETRSRSPKLTRPGPLASLVNVRLVELTPERIEAWAKVEARTRPASARLAWRLLKACMNWCATHKVYSVLVANNPTRSDKARETLGKPKKRHDVLQREMLSAWFAAVRKIGNPVLGAYLQTLLLTGARRRELAALKWEDVNFQWNSMKLADKIEDFRVVPLTPYVSYLLGKLPRRNEYVFSSATSESGYIAEPRIAHNEAVAVAGLQDLTLHGLRRSFATLSEWVETPAGIAAQIQGHAPQGVREQNYIRRPLDLLRVWHSRIESWILQQAGIEFTSVAHGLRIVDTA